MAAKTTKKAETAAKTTEAVKAPAAEKAKAVKATKPAAKAKAAPKTATKTAKTTKTAKATPAVKVFVEYQGRQVDMDAVLEAVKATAGVKTVKSLEVYVKPEDGAAYYVVNGKDSGKAEL